MAVVKRQVLDLAAASQWPIESDDERRMASEPFQDARG